jgi:hypothetical protein
MNETIILLTIALELALVNVYRFSPQKQVDDCVKRSMATRLAKGERPKLKRVIYG